MLQKSSNSPFGLRSSGKVGGASGNARKKMIFLAISLCLHYLCGIETINFFIQTL